MRSSRLALLLVTALSCCACFQMTTVLKLNGDGSGTIEHRMLFTNAAITQMRQLTMLGGRGTFDPTSEKQARDLATTIGTGVAYVSSTPIVTPDFQGRETTYAFSDVSQLGIATQPAAPGGVTVRAQGLSTDGNTIRFTLSREPNGNLVLHVHAPQPAFLDAIGPAAAPNQIGMIRAMLAGAHVLLMAEPAGTVVRTSSAYVDGSRVTLLEVDLDRVLKDEALLARLQAAKTEDEMKAILKDAPGVKINFDSEITVEFTPVQKH